MNLDIGYSIDPGPREGVNQDSLSVLIPEDHPETAVLIVSDGMGGAKAGEKASREAVRVIADRLMVPGDFPSIKTAHDRLYTAVSAANESIFLKAQTYPEMEGMGCTVVVALVMGDQFWIASVGDSRAYLLRDVRLDQLTEDHTWVNARVRDGILTREQAAVHSLRHVLDRALGTRPEVEVDIWQDEILEAGDALVLCSDGLYGVLSESDIAAAAALKPAQRAADALLQSALDAPARDNISVIVLQVSE